MIEGLLQPTHLLLILGAALLLFGPKKLPELGKGLGDGIRNFKNSMKESNVPSVKDGSNDHRADSDHKPDIE